MMNEPLADVALLAPVHEQHLASGLEVSDATGFVAFGTDAALTLLEFRSLVDEAHQADILFYASHSQKGGPPRAAYRGRFAGYDGANMGKAKIAWLKHRPPSTHSDTAWSGFYLVRDLQRIEQPVLIAALKKRGGNAKLAKTFVPIGPLIIDTPF
jgi:hypothetical protein